MLANVVDVNVIVVAPLDLVVVVVGGGGVVELVGVLTVVPTEV